MGVKWDSSMQQALGRQDALVAADGGGGACLGVKMECQKSMIVNCIQVGMLLLLKMGKC